MTPDYPLTLLEGLTTIGHFCLLDHPNPTKKVRGDPLAAESHPLSFQVNKSSELYTEITSERPPSTPKELS